MRSFSASSYATALGVALCFASGCPGDDPGAEWQIVHEDLPGALVSVWGTSASDVWSVGADARDGSGPLVLHYDGTAWERIETGQTAGGLWWVFGFEGGPIYMGGEGGVIFRYEGGTFTPMTTPGIGTIFGIWGASPDDVWAVGGSSEAAGGFAWRLVGGGDTWTEALPPDPERPAVWKVWGTRTDEAWLVGASGLSLHWDGSALTPGDTGVGSSLFTVHTNGIRYAAVGGLTNGIIVEYADGAWHNVTPSTTLPALAGVCLGTNETGIAVGAYGGVYVRDAEGWHEEDMGFFLMESFHGSWIDPDGGLWAVGGQLFSRPFTAGVMVHRGEPIPMGGL
jgi:hypothetical protein